MLSFRFKTQTSKNIVDTTFKFDASVATSKFFEWTQVRIDVYIPHCKYPIKPHLWLWFSAACGGAIVHRIPFFQLYQQKKSSESKIKV